MTYTNDKTVHHDIMGYTTYAILAVRPGSLTPRQKESLIAILSKAGIASQIRNCWAAWHAEEELLKFGQIVKAYPTKFYLLCRGQDDDDECMYIFNNGKTPYTQRKLALPQLKDFPKECDHNDNNADECEHCEDASDMYYDYRMTVTEAPIKAGILEEIVVSPLSKTKWH